MSSQVPIRPPSSRTLSWAALVKKAWGDQWHKRETVYEFSNGKKFESTDYGETGIYRRS